jgi:hypothetical protein
VLLLSTSLQLPGWYLQKREDDFPPVPSWLIMCYLLPDMSFYSQGKRELNIKRFVVLLSPSRQVSGWHYQSHDHRYRLHNDNRKYGKRSRTKHETEAYETMYHDMEK